MLAAQLTIDEDGEAQEIQVSLASTRVPTNVGIPLGEQHGTTLEASASKVGHHLRREGEKFSRSP